MIDWAVARRLTGGDEDLLRDLIGMFPSESAKHLDEVRRGIELGDAELVRRGAHSLKSAAGLFGAQELVDKALQLERSGTDGELSAAPQQLEAIEKATAMLVAAFQEC